MKYTEAELLQMLQDHMEEGAEVLLQEYTGLLWAVCGRRLDDEEDIRECVNDTFAEFCLNLQQFDPAQSSLKNYLCMIADRRSVDCWRKNRRRTEAENAVFQQAGCGCEDFAEMTAERLDEALSMLNPEEKQIIRMKYYEGLTYKEIAQQLNLNYDMVKKRGLRSHKKLMRLLLVLVLVLALLAACAVTVLHHYKYTGKLGFIWSGEEMILEAEETDVVWSSGRADFKLSDAVYTDGVLSMYLTVTWNGALEDMFTEEDEHANREIAEGYELLSMHDITRDKWFRSRDKHPTMNWFGNFNPASERKLEYEILFPDSEPLRSAQNLSFELYFKDEPIGFLQMKPVAEEEFRERDEHAVLSTGAVFAVGPGRVESPLSSVILLQTEEGSEQISDRLYSHVMGLGSMVVPPTVLTGADGTEYPSVNVSCTKNTSGIGTFINAYQLYFPGAAAGEYILHIPQICIQRQGESEEAVIPLPAEEGEHLDCDVMALFPEGFGMHITGVTCSVDVHQDYDMGPDGSMVLAEEEKEWRYTIEYEVIQGDDDLYQFCMAAPDALLYDEAGMDLANEGASVNGLDIKFDKEIQLDSIPVKFKNPVFLLEESISLPVILEE